MADAGTLIDGWAAMATFTIISVALGIGRRVGTAGPALRVWHVALFTGARRLVFRLVFVVVVIVITTIVVVVVVIVACVTVVRLIVLFLAVGSKATSFVAGADGT